MNSDGKCKTKWCRNDRAKGRTICHKCHSRNFKQRNPDAYYFNALRNNARRRGKEFNLTLEEFRSFCQVTDYLALKGKTKFDMSVDRIDNNKGYHLENMQVLTLSENGIKGNIEKQCPF